jgi:hypothetical protein
MAAALREAAEQVDAWGQPVSYNTIGSDDDDAALFNSLTDDADFKCTRWTKHSSRKRDRIDELALDADRQATRRLKQIGRRAYAIELVEKQQRQLPASPHGYPDYLWTTATMKPLAPADRKTAAVTRIINRQKRNKPRIRVWRAA